MPIPCLAALLREGMPERKVNHTFPYVLIVIVILVFQTFSFIDLLDYYEVAVETWRKILYTSH